MADNIWKFHVKEECLEQFLSMNEHDWPILFRRSAEYGNTTIKECGEGPLVRITTDTWASREAFDRFLADTRNKMDYDALDELHAKLYDKAEHLGFNDFDL